MPLLEVHRLAVGIQRGKTTLPAVDGISFSIQAGEILGIVGESGCGKSLTCLSIPGLLPQAARVTGGTITWRAGPEGAALELGTADEKALREIRGKEISMIFQEPRQSLNPLWKIGPQIAETLELHGLKDKRQERALVLEILAKLGFAEPERIAGSYPHQLSGGMCQRAMIAIAAICRPRLLIADEPATALDTATQEQILSLLGEINRDFGTAILFISHDLSVVRRFCGRILVMYAGKILEEGPSETLFSAPLHPYTKGLIAALPGKARRGRPLANIPGRVPSIEDRLPGCPFAPRCAYAEERCRRSFPEEAVAGGEAARRRVFCCLAGADYA